MPLRPAIAFHLPVFICVYSCPLAVQENMSSRIMDFESLFAAHDGVDTGHAASADGIFSFQQCKNFEVIRKGKHVERSHLDDLVLCRQLLNISLESRRVAA